MYFFRLSVTAKDLAHQIDRIRLVTMYPLVVSGLAHGFFQNFYIVEVFSQVVAPILTIHLAKKNMHVFSLFSQASEFWL